MPSDDDDVKKSGANGEEGDDFPAVDPPTGSSASMGDSSDVAELVQAMAGFGGDAADDSNSVFLGDDTSQQPLLTTPQ